MPGSVYGSLGAKIVSPTGENKSFPPESITWTWDLFFLHFGNIAILLLHLYIISSFLSFFSQKVGKIWQVLIKKKRIILYLLGENKRSMAKTIVDTPGLRLKRKQNTTKQKETKQRKVHRPDSKQTASWWRHGCTKYIEFADMAARCLYYWPSLKRGCLIFKNIVQLFLTGKQKNWYIQCLWVPSKPSQILLKFR